jgi:D-sedoheptulose 7-phosphate isomerase
MTRKSTSNRGPLDQMARASLRESGSSMRRLEHACASAVAAAADAAITCLQNGGTMYFCGNGGSAADAQHLAAELAGRYTFDRPPLPAVALTTNSSSVTAIGNDYGYDQVFSRQLEGLGTAGDVLVAISTSGGSANVTRAVDAAKKMGMTVIGFTGAKGSSFAVKCDFALITPSFSTPRIQEGHIAMGHALCELIERALFETDGSKGTGAQKAKRRRTPAARPAKGAAAKVTPIGRAAAKPRAGRGAKRKH